MPDVTVISVYEPLVAAGGAPWGEYDGTWGRVIYNNTGIDGLAGDGAGVVVVSDLFQTNEATVGSVVYDEDAASGSFAYANGLLSQSFTANQNPGTSNTLDIGSLGDGGCCRFFVSMGISTKSSFTHRC